MNETVSVRNLCLTFADGKRVLDGISFELSSGDFVALLGPNGCGKSTLLKTVAGISPLSPIGDVLFRGERFLAQSPGFRARAIAYASHDLTTEFPLTAYEAILLARTAASSGFFDQISAEDKRSVENAIELCLCGAWRNRDIRTLSGGERQLVGLARAIAQGAKILFLDEALSQMDLHHQVRMGRMLRSLSKQGYAIVLVSHDLNFASEWAPVTFLMKEGGLITQGATTQVLNARNLEQLFPGEKWLVGSNPATGAPKVFPT